jgi:hypothetical protein
LAGVRRTHKVAHCGTLWMILNHSDRDAQAQPPLFHDSEFLKVLDKNLRRVVGNYISHLFKLCPARLF